MMTTTPNPSEEQIEKAARAFFREYHGEDIWPEIWDDGELDTRSRSLAATRAALTAAGVAPQPVVDEAALAEVIADAPHSGDPNVSCLDPRCKAAAVAAWLREGVAPQEPSQTETKSGNNFVSLDPEKVAAQGAEPQASKKSCGPCRRGQHGCCDGNEYLRCECSHGAAPVLPSSICQHNMVSYTDSVSEKPENFCSLCGYQPSSGVDEETLANLIHSTSVAHFGGLDPRVAPIIARAVAEFLKGEER